MFSTPSSGATYESLVPSGANVGKAFSGFPNKTCMGINDESVLNNELEKQTNKLSKIEEKRIEYLLTLKPFFYGSRSTRKDNKDSAFLCGCSVLKNDIDYYFVEYFLLASQDETWKSFTITDTFEGF